MWALIQSRTGTSGQVVINFLILDLKSTLKYISENILRKVDEKTNRVTVRALLAF